MVIVSMNPFRCRVWRLHDRLEEEVTEQTCADEIRSFEKHGQLVPVLGRRLIGDLEHEVELIYGARRLFVARHLNLPLQVEVRNLTDREGFVAMDMENRQRKDVSPYERGLSYARWLRSGYFSSQDELSRSLNLSASQVSRLLKLARLPSVIINAFANVSEICEGWGGELADALSDPVRRPSLIRVAREISSMERRPQARDVYRQLLSSTVQGRKPRVGNHDRVVKGRDGRPVFRIRRHVDSIALILPAERVSASNLEEIGQAILRILESGVKLSATPAHPRLPDMARSANIC